MQCIKDLFRNDILEPKCAFATPKLNTELDRRSLEENPTDFILSPPRIPEYWCRVNIPSYKFPKHIQSGLQYTLFFFLYVPYLPNFSRSSIIIKYILNKIISYVTG